MPSLDTGELLLEVTSEGGFINPAAHIGQLPLVVVDSAGRIYTPDAAGAGSTLVPSVVVRDVGSAGADQIIAALRAAGLDQQGGSGGIVADTGVTVFTVELDGQEYVNRIAAGGPRGPGNPGGGSSAALDLLGRLTDPTEQWGAANVPTSTLNPAAYRIYAAPTETPGPDSVDWPLDQPLADFGTPQTPDYGLAGLRSGIALGDDSVRIADAFASAAADTVVVSDGQAFQVWVEPILPPLAG